jgi:hypothetical protein
MADELIVEQAAKEVIDEVAESTSTTGGKILLVLGGVCLGAVTGYIFAKKQLEAKYKKMAEEEIDEIRAHYLAKQQASSEKKPLDEVMEEHGYKTKLEGPDETIFMKIEPEGEPEEPEEPEEAEETQNVFVPPDIQPWSYEEELKARAANPGVPYVISRDEFGEDEPGYVQEHLTYFEGDDVLADSHDTPVDDMDAMICLGNLLKFGHGSGDPSVVFVRNDDLQLDIEICHSSGKFSEIVHGVSDDELRHSMRRRRRREEK